MSLFLTDSELARVRASSTTPGYANLYWGMLNRVAQYTASPGQLGPGATTEWWHNATERLTDAAIAFRLKPDEPLRAWLRGVALDMVRRPTDDWIGPFFRNHTADPPVGHLETAHLAMAVSVVYDLAPDIFTDAERAEIRKVLAETAVPLCRNWIEACANLANWRCILLAGLAAAAAVLDDKPSLAYARAEYELCLDVAQPDGSYAESLQYSNYCYFGLMIAYESLVRSDPGLAGEISIEPYARAVDWFVHCLFYNKPLAGWGAYPRPRSANFNDSAAVFGPDPDLLMHISARAKHVLPAQAGLARWLFDELYIDHPAQGPFDRNTFGFVNRYGFLSMILYPEAAEAVSPAEAPLPTTARFSNGQCLTRNAWADGRTVLAFSGAPDPLHAPGHLHADLNSLILVHNHERLLADPGHTCYRSAVHEYDCSTRAHNTCTFSFTTRDAGKRVLGQRLCATRRIELPGKHVAAPVRRPGQFLLGARVDDVTVFGADAGEAYGAPIESFQRFSILAGEHVLFVVDRIRASEPVVTHWNWLLNNRDDVLEYKLVHPDRIVARRGAAGMKLFHVHDSSPSGPHYGHIHDAYHPLPDQLGEGKPGSGLHFVWTARRAATHVECIHAVALDEYGLVAGWHLRQDDGGVALEGPRAACNWRLHTSADALQLDETVSGRAYTVERRDDGWLASK